MRKKRKVPQVLWRLFGDKAHTLSSTIRSLILPSHSHGCKEDTTPLKLHQPRDPSDYIKLLNHCFVVLDGDAPPVNVVAEHPHNNWSQHEIVVRTIEMMIIIGGKSTVSNNVLCSAYDKCNRSSPIIELLTSSAWSLLLKRVGDHIMVYLLKHASIFLPLHPKNHYQVAGPPVNSLALKLMKITAEPWLQDPSVTRFGHKKMEVFDSANSLSDIPQHNPICVRGCEGCVGCNGNYIKPSSGHPVENNCQVSVFQAAATMKGADSAEYEWHSNEKLANLRKHSRHFRWQRCKKRKHSDVSESTSTPADRCCLTNVLEAALSTTGAATMNYEGSVTENLQDVNQVMEKESSKKRSRQFRWQRYKKRRHLDVEVANEKTFYLMNCIDEDTEAGRLQCNFKSHSHNKMPQQCCCLILQDAHLFTKGTQINRQPIFYNLERSSSVLPRKHVLNTLKPNLSGLESLIRGIFGLSKVNANAPSVLCSHSSGSCRFDSTCLYHSLIKFLKTLSRRTRCCKHLQLLDKHCTVPSLARVTNQNASSVFEDNNPESKVTEKSQSVSGEHCNRTLASEDPQIEAIKSYCSKGQVVSFIWAACRSLVPPDMLGTHSNWRILRRNISKFVQLRRFEKFSIKQCMHKLKTSGFPFLSDRHSLCCLDARMLNNLPEGPDKSDVVISNFKHVLLEKWIFWFFSCLVVPLLQANFYITESEHGKQDVFYYRKSTWEKLRNTTIAGLKDQNYQHLDPSEVQSIVGNRLFGFSKLRLRPKGNGARMLANLKAPSRMPVQESSSTGIPGKTHCFSKKVKYKYFKSVNYVLRDLHAVLKGILFKEPEKLGSSVFDYNDIYRKLCLFIIGLKNGLSTIPSVYIVVADVSKAFDSVDQDKLLSVMKDILQEDKYLLQQTSQVVCTEKFLWINENLTLADPVIGTSYTKKSGARFGSLQTVLVNQGLCRYMKKKEVLFNLYEHVKRNVLQLDKTFYLQGIGIPQGSILSSLLCSVYYGHLERNVLFPFIEKACGPTVEDLSRRCSYQESSVTGNNDEDRIASFSCQILLRLIDDLCFISTSKKQAESFYSRLQRGFRDYNCYMNEEKFCLNFQSEHELSLPSNKVYVGEDGISFIRWSGLLLNSCTLEVQADYTRYLGNHLRSTLTVSWQGKPGRHLKAKLCAFMRPKCHPIFFDSNINTGPVVRLNIYQAFLLCAMKFHCYISELFICKLHPEFHLKVIQRSFRYMYALIRKTMSSIRTGAHFHPILQLEAGEVEWLGLKAFFKVLKRKQSRHKELLNLLRSKLLAHEINGKASSQLRYAVNGSHSSVMWKIKY